MIDKAIDNNPKRTPSDFLRARKPKLFSDSIIEERPFIEKARFEYHLETLTSRNEERAFETFCFRLAKRRICSNLRPQTGPTGGGDSKVDTETYPISDEITERWYEGIGREAGKERWAFAFSAKKKWQDKVNSDIASIASTNREYKRAYFISNQYISDKQRANYEQKLTDKYGFNVYIFDRNWIIQEVYDNDLLDMAIESLNISVSKKPQPIKGPHDVARENELRALKEIIDNTETLISEDLIDAYLQSALISRGLGRPREEIRGLFYTAENLAEKYNSLQHKKIIFSHIETFFWWYDDCNFLNQEYIKLEKLIIGTQSSWDHEYLVNLHNFLDISISHGLLTIEESKFKIRTERLCASLQHIVNSESGSNALWARTQLMFIYLIQAKHDLSKLPDIFNEFSKIIDMATGKIEYPLQILLELIGELNNILDDSIELDQLIEKIIKISVERAQEIEQGTWCANQGWKKLKFGKWKDAIKNFERARLLLAKKEYSDDFYRVLIGLALSYESAGLLWASRNTAIIALNHVFLTELKDSKISKFIPLLVKKIVWLELQIGRVPAIISWYKIIQIYNPVFEEDIEEEVKLIDCVLGILILKSNSEDLQQVPESPEILENAGLPMASIASMYALGHVEETTMEINDTEEDLHKCITGWYFQPATKDLPIKPDWGISQDLLFKAYAMWCEISWMTPSNNAAILFSEAVLGFIEAAYSTSSEIFFAHRAKIMCILEIDDSSESEKIIAIEEDKCGNQIIRIKCSTIFLNNYVNEPSESKFLIEIFATILKLCMIAKADDSVEVFFQEETLDKALFLANLPICMANTISSDYTVNWSSIINNTEVRKKYKYIRQKEWFYDISLQYDGGIASPENISQDESKNHIEFESIKHNEIRILDLINPRLWDNAGWSGLAFFDTQSHPLVMAILFRSEDAAKKIFYGLKERISTNDEHNLLEITILTDIDVNNPFHYNVMFHQNMDVGSSSKISVQPVYLQARIHKMTPQSDVNLNNFIGLFSKFGSFLLIPAILNSNRQISPFLDLGIIKNKITIKKAYTIGINDPAGMMITNDLQPIVPPDIDEPPYLETLAVKYNTKNK